MTTKTLCGVGVVDLPRPTKNIPEIYKAWVGMLRRCYCSNTQKRQPTYVGCSVDPAWHKLSDFVLWALQNDYQGKQLDKDILVNGNKIYGPNTCLFVSQRINNLLHSGDSYRGQWPIGVTKPSQKKYNFVVYMRKNGKPTFQGYFQDMNQAAQHYLQIKSKYVEDVAKSLKCIKTQTALFRIANEIKQGSYY